MAKFTLNILFVIFSYVLSIQISVRATLKLTDEQYKDFSNNKDKLQSWLLDPKVSKILILSKDETTLTKQKATIDALIKDFGSRAIIMTLKPGEKGSWSNVYDSYKKPASLTYGFFYSGKLSYTAKDDVKQLRKNVCRLFEISSNKPECN